MKVHICRNDDEKLEIVEVDEFDVRSLDHTLSLIIKPALEQFKKQLRKPPPHCMFDKDFAPYQRVEETFEQYDARLQKAEAAAMLRWNRTIDHMIYAFDKISQADPMWEYDPEQKKLVQEGLDLFARYYRNLWT